MARVLTVCSLMMFLVNAHLILAVADDVGEDVITEAATARKLGGHNLHSNDTTASSPSEALKVEESGGSVAQEQVMKTHHHHHPSIDNSVAGGGVILGGLAAIFLVAVFCYIRATRRKTILPATGGEKNAGPGSATAP